VVGYFSASDLFLSNSGEGAEKLLTSGIPGKFLTNHVNCGRSIIDLFKIDDD